MPDEVRLCLLEANLSPSFRCLEHEVLIYRPGDMFEEHTDRTSGDEHVGTLFLVVSSPDLVGGHLVAAGEVLGRQGKPFLTFIPLGVRHEVTLVTAGKARLVAKAAVYALHTVPAAKPDWRMD